MTNMRIMTGFLFALLVGIVLPQATFAAVLKEPKRLDVSGGIYTNDNTPTVTWTSPIGATWYEILLDNGSWRSLGNVNAYTFESQNDGWHTIYVRAHDNAGQTSIAKSVTLEIDTQGPTVPAVWPTTAKENTSTTFWVTPYGEASTTTCTLYVDNKSVGTMTKNGNAFQKTYTFSWDGTYTAYARCTDGDGNVTVGTSRTVTVTNTNNDTPVSEETFWVSNVTPTSATQDESTTMRVTTSGTLDAETCTLYVNGSSVGTMSETSRNSFAKTYTFSNDGTYSVYAYCQDENNDWTKGSSRTVTVTQEVIDDHDTDSLDVPTVSPGSAYEDERIEFTVKPDSNYNVTECWLYVDGARVAEMNEESTNRFVVDYTFRNSGSYSVYAYCKDSHDDTAIGEKRTVRVSDRDYDDDDSNTISRGSLIKTVCGNTVTSLDTCKTVYYYGKDGKRHAFPNETTYFSWYNDFDDVIEVSGNFMSSLSIGKNVTYRPGSVLIRFASSSSIYAIESAHTLHRYTTTSLIESDYGKNWDDVLMNLPDSLYNNYTIGSVIDSTHDYDRDDEYFSVNSIDDVL